MSDPPPPPVWQLPLFHLMPLAASGGGALPGIPDPLIGREGELARLLQLIEVHHTRLLTLTGAGGTGKTRLAVELAARVQDRFADGVAFVPLASISDPERVRDTVARALGIREVAGEAIHDRLLAHLHDRQLLLVLDNFEHLLDAAAPVVSKLLADCPRLTILVTSRAPLRLTLEREVVVPPLALPPPDAVHEVEQAASVQLFVQAAQEVAPGFALTPANAHAIAAICRRLDGLPLAIRLAASRSRVLDPESLLARLDRRLPLLGGGNRDTPERQQTMRNAIGWSWDLLETHEQVLFRRLSVFAGGFTLETAEALGRELSPVLLLDTLETLIDHHLVERENRDGDLRFTMLETIREYALEQLEASGEAAIVRDAHAATITAWCERTKPLMFEADQARWLARGAAEHPNIRAALAWTLEQGDASMAYRLAASHVWLKHGTFREAREWLDRVLALPGPAPVEAINVCRFLASAIALGMGERDLAMEHAQASLVLARQSGDRFGEGHALMMQCDILMGTDLDAAERANEAALACVADLPDRWVGTSMLRTRAVIAYLRGDNAAFATLARDAHELAVEAGDPYSVVSGLFLRALAAVANRTETEAPVHLREALDIAEPLGSPPLLAGVAQIGALVAGTSGDHRLAMRWLTAGNAAAASMGRVVGHEFAAWEQSVVANARKALSLRAVQIEEAAALHVPLATIAGEVRHYRPGRHAASVPGPFGTVRLTAREQDVLRLIAAGLTDHQIGEALFIARPTVSKHVGNILAKLDVTSRTAAVDTAHRLGLIDDSTSSLDT